MKRRRYQRSIKTGKMCDKLGNLISDLFRIEDLSSKLKSETRSRETAIQKIEEDSSAAVGKLEREKFDLLEKLSRAESKIAELAKLAVKSTPDEVSRLRDKTDNGEVEGQINFLNSIIANQQKAIDQLNLKVQILTMGGVEGVR